MLLGCYVWKLSIFGQNQVLSYTSVPRHFVVCSFAFWIYTKTVLLPLSAWQLLIYSFSLHHCSAQHWHSFREEGCNLWLYAKAFFPTACHSWQGWGVYFCLIVVGFRKSLHHFYTTLNPKYLYVVDYLCKFRQAGELWRCVCCCVFGSEILQNTTQKQSLCNSVVLQGEIFLWETLSICLLKYIIPDS